MASTTNTVVFTLNGVQQSVSNVEPYTTLNDYIRAQPNLKGTKHNCGQGGCGVCVVNVTSKSAGGALTTVPVNSCLRPLLSCHGQEVTTVEGIGVMGNLHPVQTALANNNGSQCGFCTSGMVSTMYGLLQSNPSPTTDQIVQSLDGNLCRCTGYRPIIAAFKTFGTDFVDPVESSRGGCCGSVKEAFPDIEELAVNASAGRRYCAGDHARVVRLPQVAPLSVSGASGNQWVSVTSLADLFDALATAPATSYQLVVGNTSSGIYPMPVPKLSIDVSGVPALRGAAVNTASQQLVVGAAESISTLYNLIESNLKGLPAYFARAHAFLRRVASYTIRNAGSVAGNLMMANLQGFTSDLLTLLVALDATLTVATSPTATVVVRAADFVGFDMSRKVVLSIAVSFAAAARPSVFFVEKAALRSRFAHALVNFGANVSLQGTVVTTVTALVVGGLPGPAVGLPRTATALVGKDMSNSDNFVAAFQALSAELDALLARGTVRDAAYRKQCALNLFYKLVLTLQASLPSSLRSATQPFRRAPSSGHQTYQNPGDPSEGPVSYPIPKLMEEQQTCGAVVYSGDEPVLPGTLYAAPVYSTVAVADITSIDASGALGLEGVVAFIGAKDLADPDFKWGVLYQDEPLFARSAVACYGQLIGLIVAEDQLLADMGSRLVSVKYANSRAPVLTIDDAIAAKSFYPTDWPGVNFPITVGDVQRAFGASTHVISGDVYQGSQIHMQMEPQTFYAVPQEAGTLKMIGAFQLQAMVQQVIAGALRMPQGKIVVETRRIGGAYGAKITRPAGLAAATALAATKLGRPVKMAMRIQFQNDMIGKRNQVKASYKIGFEPSGKVNGIAVTVYQQSGAFFDGDNFNFGAMITSLSNCYDIANWQIDGVSCKTNIAAQTSVRGPGWTAGNFLAEAMLEDVAAFLNVDPLGVKGINLGSATGWTTPYGQKLTYFPIQSMTLQLQQSSNYVQRKQEVDAYNAANAWTKRGIAFVPARFNVSNANDPMSAQVVCFGDGTIQISSGGIEMGQGLNTKVAQAVVMRLGCMDVRLCSFLPASTVSSSQNGATGGSVTSEICVAAALMACDEINQKLAPFRQQNPKATWPQLCAAATATGLDLRSVKQAILPPPADGMPDVYQTFGVCILEVFLDVLTGESNILRADILMDLGISMNPLLDVGQVEGAFLMGVGLNTLEEVQYDADGTLFTRDTWEYKIPGAMDVPIDWRVTLLANAPNPRGVLRSRAVGEPPLLMGCAAIFALKYAVNAARAAAGQSGRFRFDSPATVPRILETLAREKVFTPSSYRLK